MKIRLGQILSSFVYSKCPYFAIIVKTLLEIEFLFGGFRFEHFEYDAKVFYLLLFLQRSQLLIVSDPLYITCSFLTACKVSFSLAFSSWAMMFQVVVSIVFILLWIHWYSWICNLTFSTKFGVVSDISSNVFPVPFSTPSPSEIITYMLAASYCPSYLRLWSLSPLFELSSYWSILKFTNSATSNLLFKPSKKNTKFSV